MEESITATKLEKTQGRKKTRRRGPRLTGVSRQRRMANARERSRVQNLNAHIERLRDLIPLFPGEKKPSKTETIRLAAVYISCLTDILEAAPEGLGRISSDDLMPTFPELEDSFSLASGIPPTLSLPKFLFEPLCDEDFKRNCANFLMKETQFTLGLYPYQTIYTLQATCKWQFDNRQLYIEPK
ncbi:Protein atonal, partial [Acropora cervicornis]